jgi:hypothetical protein
MFDSVIKYRLIGFDMKAGKILIQGLLSLIFVLFVCEQVVFSGESELTPAEKRRIESEAIDTFDQIIFLCKRNRFDEIYEYGDTASQERISKDTFISEHRRCPLALSWESIRDIPDVEIVSPTRVKVKATLGFRGPFFMTSFSVQIFDMTLEQGEWRTDLRYPLGIPEGQEYNEPKYFRQHRPIK